MSRFPKKMEKLNINSHQTVLIKSRKTLDFEYTVGIINNSYKVLIMMRGVPGSGKSYMSRKLLEESVGYDNNKHTSHILSTDDFFYKNGRYAYDVRMLSEAHNWNQTRAFVAMSKGVSPIIIDNTNTQMWEMKPYATMATDYGYLVQILEPDTHWCFNDKELAKRNTHGVSRVKLKEMIERYEKNITPEKLLSAYNLVYKLQKPPQLRLYPPPNLNTKRVSASNHLSHGSRKPDETINLMDFEEDTSTAKSHSIAKVNGECTSSLWAAQNPVDAMFTLTNYDTNTTILKSSQIYTVEDTVTISDEETELPSPEGNIEEMWGVNEDALRSWNIVTPLNVDFERQSNTVQDFDVSKVETRDFGCNTEEEFFRLLRTERLPPGQHKDIVVIETVGRNINRFTPTRTMGVSKKLTLDKSCLTDDIYQDFDSHISQLISLFPNVPKNHLVYWYNKCKGDLEWTIEFLLEAKEEISTLIEADISDMKQAVEEMSHSPETDSDSSNGSNSDKQTKRASKRNTRPTAESEDLKRMIEKKIDISGEHYSEKLLKVKSQKFGLPKQSAEANPTDASEPSTSKQKFALAESEDFIIIDSDIELDEVELIEDKQTVPEATVELNIGEHCVSQLESHFGDPKFQYPKGFQPVLQLPVSLARQLYTFYIESVYQQMDNQKQIMETLAKEDEEFARKLQAKEQGNSEPAASQATPNLKQIMEDQQASQIAYQKEAEKWKNLNPDNLAAKLTRQKLFSIFPTIPQDTLVEILHAHDNKYKDTVETLFASTGRENIRDDLEALSEPPINNEVIEEMKEAQRNNCIEEYEEQHEATFYREEANRYLKRRTDLYEQAQKYHQRGMTEVAQFYSGLASLQTTYYERANSMAAASFLDEHSKRLQDFNTLDLHYLFVKEAIAALDVFLDRSIHLLRVSKIKNSEYLQIITGRGKRSENGISKLKPVVQARLKKRNINFVFLNPGLLKIKVTKNSLVTSEIEK